MNAPVKVAQMTPSEDTKPVRVNADVLYLDDIPKAMDNMGWTVSAKMMRRWFATKPAWAMPEHWRGGEYSKDNPIDYRQLSPSQVDNKLITMAWALQFPQVRKAMADLKEIQLSSAAIDELKKHLWRRGWVAGQTTRLPLGHVGMSAMELDYTSQINYQRFGSVWDRVDDFFGSIFKATLKVVVVGHASRKQNGRDVFEVAYFGYYLRDTYDFNVSWYEDAFMGLGVWSKQRCLSKAEMIAYKATPVSRLSAAFPGFVPARNTDFRKWQNQRHEGGDYFVFSDVLWEPSHGTVIELS